MNTSPNPVPDDSRIGGRIALLAAAGALLIIFLTLFVVGIAFANRDDPNDPAPTLAPNAPSATALLTVAPQTPFATATNTPKSGGGGGRPTRTPTPTDTATPIPTATSTNTPSQLLYLLGVSAVDEMAAHVRLVIC